jgi:very-short-patch-repair endonuclease
VAIHVRRKRSKTKRQFRQHKPEWRDPYPQINGTLPEKMIFAQLVHRHIFFVYQDRLDEWKAGQYATMAVYDFIPDFICPQYKLIIDPFGDYHHMLPGQPERDATKMAVYNATGYAFYHPWASDVEAHGAEYILKDIPEFWAAPTYPLSAADQVFAFQGYRLGPYVGIGASSVAAANRKRRRAPLLTLRRR